ncbi:MAG: 2-polyprenyl-3-methyl-6-methoxy-1,4-benzoquinone monooxygenase [Gammaproteobacteria bacterium]|nr:2-polyprenyl-3-methyl-6-methoxy-1,4-benzoquinone monooxygenase [Gammaproteobacteria bacterium]
MLPPRPSFIDRLLVGADRALKSFAGGASLPARPSPAETLGGDRLADRERRHAAGLMRVNHAGEVAAQALYRGQGVAAGRASVRAAMQRSAAEENDHLAWCERRLSELGGRTSLLNPLWYAGSFVIGAVAGLAGDRWSLGFVAETERQVVAHLHDHLRRLPDADARSRAILRQMQRDEASHGQRATRAGGILLPSPVRAAMRLSSSLMTRTAYWI